GAPSPISTTHAISGVPGGDPEALYQSAQQAPAIIYTLPGLLPGKLYHLKLRFAEINPSMFANEARTFDIYLNNIKVVSKLDVFARAGAYNAFVADLTYQADPTGTLSVVLAQVTGGGATLSGLEVAPEATAAGYNVQDIGPVGQLPTEIG